MNIFKHSFGTAMYALSQWIMLLVITKFQGVEAAGVYSLYLAILTPLNILTNYGLRNFISSDVNHEFSETTYLSLRYFGVLVFYLLVPLDSYL